MVVLFVSLLEKTNRLFYLDAKAVIAFGSSGKLSFFLNCKVDIELSQLLNEIFRELHLFTCTWR